MTTPIYTTKECPDCGHIFERSMDHMPDVVTGHRIKQSVCPNCQKPFTPRVVRHPGVDQIPAL